MHLMWRLQNGALPTQHQVWVLGGAAAGHAVQACRYSTAAAWLAPARLAPHVAQCINRLLSLQPRVVVLLIGTNDLGTIAYKRGWTGGVEKKLRAAAPGVASR